MSFTSFGQEKPTFAVEWEELNVKISENTDMYTLEHREITPSLSYISQRIATGNYYLMEINLAVDLRRQHLKNDAPVLLLPENKFIQSDYSVALPTTTSVQNNFRVSITGNGGYNSSNTSNGGIKNNAYRDASSYTGIYCPVTGVPLTY
ncbi:hypothetical protein [uncultured Aquimarina sp.]|uniref:hypothetical protein n=1 Tax=uncultured Aquimarina sp. TaxID=575652 RepID=UPI00263949DD|nr:hypothetical protein [uncultured Aquimarina sp.]